VTAAIGAAVALLITAMFHPVGEWVRRTPARVAALFRRCSAAIGRRLMLAGTDKAWTVGECADAINIVVQSGSGNIEIVDEAKTYFMLFLVNRSPFPIRVTVQALRLQHVHHGYHVECRMNQTFDLPSLMLVGGTAEQVGQRFNVNAPLDHVAVANIRRASENMDGGRWVPYPSRIELELFAETPRGSGTFTIWVAATMTLRRS
jgi:hypothetical protein